MGVAAVGPFVVTMTTTLGCLSPSTVTSWGDWICSVCEGSRRGGALGRGGTRAERFLTLQLAPHQHTLHCVVRQEHFTHPHLIPASVCMYVDQCTVSLCVLWQGIITRYPGIGRFHPSVRWQVKLCAGGTLELWTHERASVVFAWVLGLCKLALLCWIACTRSKWTPWTRTERFLTLQLAHDQHTLHLVVRQEHLVTQCTVSLCV